MPGLILELLVQGDIIKRRPFGHFGSNENGKYTLFTC